VYGSSIFRARNGLFTPNVYDTVMYITDKYYSQNIKDLESFKKKIKILLNDSEYKKTSGASTYASKRMQLKIKRAKEIFDDK
jgi:hypothetical protein